MTVDLPPATQRALAVALDQRSWELISADRDEAEDREMLASAMGYADIALDFATAAQERCTGSEAAPRWLVASTQEGLAHAEAGHDAERDRWAAEARATLARVDDLEDRQLIESQLWTVPGLTAGRVHE